MDQDGNNFLIVGGTSGIGLELVKRLCERHSVAVWSREMGDSLSAQVKHASWDATGSAAPPGTPDRLDGMVYCPGSIRLKPVSRLTDEDFRADFDLNCLGAVRTVRACLSALRRSPSASIVLFSTVAVSQGMPMHASVAAAKGAVEGLTRALAAELAPKIRVNAIAPSLVATPLSRELTSNEKKAEAAAKRHPLARIGNAAEVATVAADLVSGRVGWVTGQVLHVDGGLSSVRLLG